MDSDAHEVRLIVTLQVETLEPGVLMTETEANGFALQAVRHALRYGEGQSFVHDGDDVVSIGIADVKVANPAP
jgi:hypothetical protein